MEFDGEGSAVGELLGAGEFVEGVDGVGDADRLAVAVGEGVGLGTRPCGVAVGVGSGLRRPVEIGRAHV